MPPPVNPPGSPFPGMDPYLERHWLDVHAALALGARAALNRILPDDLAASVEERETVGIGTGVPRDIGPDVRVNQLPPPTQAPTDSTSTSATSVVTAPYKLTLADEPVLERFVKITDILSERLIAVIEFISPTNKRGAGLREFRNKRSELLSEGVSFVEIDLTRRGNWQALLLPHQPPPSAPETEYRATVRTGGDPSTVFYFPMPLRSTLPSIPIPLRQRDPEISLALQPLIHSAYIEGRYSKRLNYSLPLDPPLAPEDLAWAQSLTKSPT